MREEVQDIAELKARTLSLQRELRTLHMDIQTGGAEKECDLDNIIKVKCYVLNCSALCQQKQTMWWVTKFGLPWDSVNPTLDALWRDYSNLYVLEPGQHGLCSTQLRAISLSFFLVTTPKFTRFLVCFQKAEAAGDRMREPLPGSYVVIHIPDDGEPEPT